jgi:C-terminal processing protease CtpA/Prc
MIKLVAFVLLSSPAAQQAPPDLTAELKRSTIEQLVRHMNERYVLADVAKKATETIQTKLKAGEYDSITSGPAFAQKLSEDLNAHAKDAHLHVMFSPNKLPQRAEATEPSQDEIAEQRDQMRRLNAGFEEVKRLRGNVGYIKTMSFANSAEMKRPAKAAFEFLKDTDALIFDMRENGGGSPDGVRWLCSYLFGEPSVHLNTLLFRTPKGLEPEEFWTVPVDGPKYLDKPIIVLAGRRTGSGAEEFCYNLQTRKRAVIIGDRTWGGANPGGVVRLNDHFSAFIPDGMAKNPVTGKNWEGTGVEPDVKVPDADVMRVGHRMALEAVLKTAKTESDRRRLESVIKELSN